MKIQILHEMLLKGIARALMREGGLRTHHVFLKRFSDLDMATLGDDLHSARLRRSDG